MCNTLEDLKRLLTAVHTPRLEELLDVVKTIQRVDDVVEHCREIKVRNGSRSFSRNMKQCIMQRSNAKPSIGSGTRTTSRRVAQADVAKANGNGGEMPEAVHKNSAHMHTTATNSGLSDLALTFLRLIPGNFLRCETLLQYVHHLGTEVDEQYRHYLQRRQHHGCGI